MCKTEKQIITDVCDMLSHVSPTIPLWECSASELPTEGEAGEEERDLKRDNGSYNRGAL